MTVVLGSLLFLHVAAGFTALLPGFGALLTRKGQRYHLWSGRVYFWSMALVAGTALPLAVLRGWTGQLSHVSFWPVPVSGSTESGQGTETSPPSCSVALEDCSA